MEERNHRSAIVLNSSTHLLSLPPTALAARTECQHGRSPTLRRPCRPCSCPDDHLVGKSSAPPPTPPRLQQPLMATSTPLHPLELPPFSLHSLLSPIFSRLPPSLPSSPTKSTFGSPPPSGSLGRLGQLVSNVAGGTAVPAAGEKVASVRSVEASGEKVWVGGSDGRVRIYEVVPPSEVEGRRGAGWEGSRSPEVGSPMSGRRTPTSPGLPREVRRSRVWRDPELIAGMGADCSAGLGGGCHGNPREEGCRPDSAAGAVGQSGHPVWCVCVLELSVPRC